MDNNRPMIVFVCRGNIARSAVAEAVAKRRLHELGLDNKYTVISRGTQGVAPDDLEPVKFRNITFYSSLYQDSKAWLEERGIDLSSHISTPIDGEVAEHASVLFAMDRKTQKALLTLYPDHAIKVHLLSELVGDDREIIDPECVSGRQKQEQIFTEIENRIVEGFPRLLVLTDSVNKTTREATGNQPEGISPRREKWI